VRRFRGRPAESIADLLEAADLFTKAGDKRSASLAFSETAMGHHGLGDLGRAREVLETSIAESRKLGDRAAEAMQLGTLGVIELETAAEAQARSHLERALELHREVGNRLFEGATLANLG